MKESNKIYIKIIACLVVFMALIIGIYYIKNSNKKEMSFELNSESVKQVNDFLDMIANNMKQNGVKYTTEKYKNKDIYSMLVTIYLKPITFSSYSIDLSTNKYLDTEQVARKFNLTLDDIIDIVENRLKTYYDEEIDLGYVDKEKCDFECYKSVHGIEMYEDIYTLYVKNEKLYIYIGFDMNSSLNDKEYFDNLKYDPYIIEA